MTESRCYTVGQKTLPHQLDFSRLGVSPHAQKQIYGVANLGASGKHSPAHLLAAALVGALASPVFAQTSAPITTPDKIETHLGTLNFERGYPTEETTRKVFDEMDYQRAVQAYLWAYPVVSFESIRIGVKRDLGLDYNDSPSPTTRRPKSVLAYGERQHGLCLTLIDLGKHGPLVVDVPPGALVGLIDDYWQRSVTDLGLPGPDGDKGGKFSSCPPATAASTRGRLPRPAGDDE